MAKKRQTAAMREVNYNIHSHNGHYITNTMYVYI